MEEQEFRRIIIHCYEIIDNMLKGKEVEKISDFTPCEKLR